MTGHKYVGMDVHSATSVIEVMNQQGKALTKAIIQTKAEAVKDFFGSLSGAVHVTFEEGIHASWLYDMIKPLVAEVIVCNPRHNRLVRSGNKADEIDAHKLAELLRLGSLKPVYHNDCGMRKLREAVRAYQALTADSLRTMNRIKAIFRGRGVDCSGGAVYRKAEREDWLNRLPETSATTRLELLYQQLDLLTLLRQQACKEMVSQARLHPAYKTLRKIKTLGPIRVAEIIGVVRSPFRFRTKRQFWPYCGLAVVTSSSADYVIRAGKICRSTKAAATRGLNENYNRTLKNVFKGAALLGTVTEPFKQYYEGLTAKGLRPALARLTLARKIAAITLAVWKTGEAFDPSKLIKGSGPLESD
jgi:transposase